MYSVLGYEEGGEEESLYPHGTPDKRDNRYTFIILTVVLLLL